MLTHRNIVAAILRSEAWFTPALKRVGDLTEVNGITTLPLYHIFALTLCLLAIRGGSHLTLIPTHGTLASSSGAERSFRMLPAVNTLFNALMQHPRLKSLDFSTLIMSAAGGMAASEGTATT